LDEDVELHDLEVGWAEGFSDSALLSAYTKLGRGVTQSKASHALGARFLAHRGSLDVSAVGRPLPRPPVRPVPMAMLAGRTAHPRRRTPLHDWHAGHGAAFLIADEWERPAVYASAGERTAAVTREVNAVRRKAGIIDVGTLGKIDVVGPDAGLFLDRVYTGLFSDMAVGSCRYALLCDESGAVLDDGVVARFAANQFYLTTTTTASSLVYRELSRWLIELGLDVTLTNLTGATAAFNLAGPRSPEVIARVADDPRIVLDCPYLGARETTIASVSARVLRVGFVGEIGYEVHLPASSALHVWSRILEAGADAGVMPFGVDAQRTLRLEKGHLIVGQDTDALSSPFEVGLGWAVKMQKPSFVSRRSLAIRKARPLARRLVGFIVEGDAGAEVRECHLVVDGSEVVGRVTSVVRSPTLGQTLGLAFVPKAWAVNGHSFAVRLNRQQRVSARVVPTPFYDPENIRQRGAGA
jgi:sarcosine oxidase subunit alpha